MVTTYERGRVEGRVEGKVEERRETALLLLETKFGAVGGDVRERLSELSPEQLRQLLLEVVEATTLAEVATLKRDRA